MTSLKKKRPRHAASQKVRRSRRQVSARSPDNTKKRKEFFASFEEGLTGPVKPSQAAYERFDDYVLQHRTDWLRRPRIHTAIFEEVWNSSQATERARKIQELANNLGWSDECLSMFKQHIVEYRQRPSIENYLKVRRQFPDAEIQIGRLGGIEALFALEKDFEKQGVDPQLVAATLDADELSIDELSLRLLERLVARDKIEIGKPGFIERRRNAISDATVNYLIAMMLEALDWNGKMTLLPGSLIVLIRHQICGSATPDLEQAYLSKEKQSNAAFLAAQLLRPGERISVRKLSKITGVPRTTAARWLADDEFNASLEAKRKWVASKEFPRLERKRKSSP